MAKILVVDDSKSALAFLEPVLMGEAILQGAVDRGGAGGAGPGKTIRQPKRQGIQPANDEN
jgi:hypothetical protein